MPASMKRHTDNAPERAICKARGGRGNGDDQRQDGSAEIVVDRQADLERQQTDEMHRQMLPPSVAALPASQKRALAAVAPRRRSTTSSEV
ncbi:MAG: hypothetical protein WDN69_04775 [Aliidongia sp.]